MINELASLRLITFHGIGGLSRVGLPSTFAVGYAGTLVKITMKEGVSEFQVGHAAFTEAGKRLAKLTDAPILPGFIEYVAEQWKQHGHEVEILSKPKQKAAGEGGL